MAPSEVTEDYYAILEVPQNATVEVVKESYRRLAKVCHPDRNLHKPSATALFQSLLAAWETIKDPAKRQEYDRKWPSISQSRITREEAGKRQAEAFKAKQKAAAADEATRRREQDTSQEQLRNLKGHRVNYDNQIFELNQVINRLTTDLNRLQEKDDEQLRKKRERDSWWTYLTSPVYGKPAEETEEQRQQLEVERIQRLNSKRIKEIDIARQKASVLDLQDKLQNVNAKIAALKKKDEDAARAREAVRQENIRKEEEAKRLAEERAVRERRAKMAATFERERKETAARAARQAREAREAQEAQAAREAEECSRLAREAQRARLNKILSQAGTSRSTGPGKTKCQHKAFWQKINGSHVCGNCHTRQSRFAFKCPGCQMMACASCRQNLRGERGQAKAHTSRSRGARSDSSDDRSNSTYSTYDFWDYD